MKNLKEKLLIGTIALTSIGAPVALFFSLDYKQNETTLINQQSKSIEPFESIEKTYVKKNILEWEDKIFPQAYKDKSIEEIYGNYSQIFKPIANILTAKPNLLYDNWVPGTTNKVVYNININTTQDSTLRMLAQYELPFRQIKNINGRLYIDVVLKDTTTNELLPADTFILCGFKREAKFLLKHTQKAKDISKKISDSINFGYQIKLNKSSYNDFVNFLCSNVFYYKNFNQPTESEFQPIPPGFLKKIDNKTLKITNVFGHEDKIFPPNDISPNHNDWIVHFYLKEARKTDSILFYVSLGLFILLLLSIVIYIVLVITRRAVRV